MPPLQVTPFHELTHGSLPACQDDRSDGQVAGVTADFRASSAEMKIGGEGGDGNGGNKGGGGGMGHDWFRPVLVKTTLVVLFHGGGRKPHSAVLFARTRRVTAVKPKGHDDGRVPVKAL